MVTSTWESGFIFIKVRAFKQPWLEAYGICGAVLWEFLKVTDDHDNRTNDQSVGKSPSPKCQIH
jgi:hypothetical protein